MQNKFSKYFILVAIFFVLPNFAWAAPSISGIAGTIVHGQGVTISGSGFGTKSTAAPIVWDNCSGTNINNFWDSGLPISSGGGYDLQYTTPIRSVSLPHSHITKYMTGANYPESNYYAGYNVGPAKSFNMTSFPSDVYFSYYYRQDPLWSFGDGTGTGNNNKFFQVAKAGEPYGGTQYGYLEYYYLTSSQSGATVHRNDDGIGWTSQYAGAAQNPLASWRKYEVFIRFNSGSSGIMQFYDNGSLVLDYAGVTTTAGAGSYSIGPVGYSGGVTHVATANDFRYFADLYVDSKIICDSEELLNEVKDIFKIKVL